MRLLLGFIGESRKRKATPWRWFRGLLNCDLGRWRGSRRRRRRWLCVREQLSRNYFGVWLSIGGVRYGDNGRAALYRLEVVVEEVIVSPATELILHVRPETGRPAD